MDFKCPICGKLKDSAMKLSKHMAQTINKREEHLNWLKYELGETKPFKPIADKLEAYFKEKFASIPSS